MRLPPKVKPQAVMNVSIYHLGCEAIQSCDISLVKINSKSWGCSTVCNSLAFPFSFSHFCLKGVMVCSNPHLCSSDTSWSQACKELQSHPNKTCSIREMMGLRDQLLGEGRSKPAGTFICPSCILTAVQSQACCLCTRPSFSSSRNVQVWRCESVPACLPLPRNSCVLGCEGWMHLQGTLLIWPSAWEGSQTRSCLHVLIKTGLAPSGVAQTNSKFLWQGHCWGEQTSSEIKPLNCLQSKGTSCFGSTDPFLACWMTC